MLQGIAEMREWASAPTSVRFIRFLIEATH
jgi:hypothetical protein